MKVIYTNFDGLEFTIKQVLPSKLALMMEEAKEQLKSTEEITALFFGDHHLLLHATGAKGYAYRCTERKTGIWFFKKPNERDPWGIRFSASSHALATNGLEGVRKDCAALMEAMGINAPESSYCPSRVDFAVDFIDPAFMLDPEQFVVAAQTGKKGVYSTDAPDQIQVSGRANRIESVTVGKMPRRQIIIYNKSREVAVRGKSEWPIIWREALGDDARVLDGATVWRAEIRVAKRHLKDDWHVEGWHSFYELLAQIFRKLLQDYRYCETGTDINRARWRDHPLWDCLHEIIETDLFDYVPNFDPDLVTSVKRETKLDELHTQILGLFISTAAINGVDETEFDAYLLETSTTLAHRIAGMKPRLRDKLTKAQSKYMHLK